MAIVPAKIGMKQSIKFSKFFMVLETETMQFIIGVIKIVQVQSVVIRLRMGDRLFSFGLKLSNKEVIKIIAMQLAKIKIGVFMVWIAFLKMKLKKFLIENLLICEISGDSMPKSFKFFLVSSSIEFLRLFASLSSN